VDLFEISIASGSKCKNAPPIKAPADNPTSANNIFFNRFSDSTSVMTPINDIKQIHESRC
jgi:hypothetical protein